MATGEIDLFNATIKPVGNSCWLEPATVAAVSGIHEGMLLISDNVPSATGIKGSFRVPADYDPNTDPTIELVLDANATSGVARCEAQYRGVADAEGLAQTTYGTTGKTVDVTMPGTAFLRKSATITLTGTDLAAGDEVQFYLFRDGGHANDTLAAQLRWHHATLKYTKA